MPDRGQQLVDVQRPELPQCPVRATTFVDAIEDKFNLQRWMQLKVATGLSKRPDLLLAVSAHGTDKAKLDDIFADARQAAEASAAATTGTALHALTELVDTHSPLPRFPGQPTPTWTPTPP